MKHPAPPALLLLLAACAPKPPAGQAPADSLQTPATDSALPVATDTALASAPLVQPDSALVLVAAYVDHFGQTPSQVRAALGRPDSMITRTFRNEYDSTVTDTVFTLHYRGFALQLYVGPLGSHGFAAALEVTAPRSDVPFGLGVGAPCSRLRAVLGEPVRVDSLGDRPILRYEAGELPNVVLFDCHAGAISRVRWFPWVD